MQTRRTRFLPKALAVEFRRLPWRLLGLWLFALAVAGWLALLELVVRRSKPQQRNESAAA